MGFNSGFKGLKGPILDVYDDDDELRVLEIMPMYLYGNISLNFYYVREMFQTKVVQKIKTHILNSITFCLIVLFMR